MSASSGADGLVDAAAPSTKVVGPSNDVGEQHVDGVRCLPSIGPDGWARYPSVTQRYYTTHTTSNYQALHVHSNGICVLGVAASHPMLQHPLHVTGVAFRSHDSKNLMETAVRGKKKAGAVFVTPRDMVCTATVSDGSEVVLYACVRASVVEVNQRLLERPELLGTPEGYVAILMPKLEEKKTIGEACLEFDRQSPLDSLSTNAKRKLEGKAPRSTKQKRQSACFAFQRTGTCKFGNKCRFAHVKAEAEGTGAEGSGEAGSATSGAVGEAAAGDAAAGDAASAEAAGEAVETSAGSVAGCNTPEANATDGSRA